MSIGTITNITQPQEEGKIVGATNTSLAELCESTHSGETKKFIAEGLSNLSDWGWSDRNFNVALVTVEKYIAIGIITAKCVRGNGEIGVKYAYYISGEVIFTN